MIYVLNGAVYRNDINVFDLEGNSKGSYPGWYNWPQDLIVGGDPDHPQILLSAIGAMNDNGNLDFGLVLYDGYGDFFHGFHKEDTGLERPYGLAKLPGGDQAVVCDWTHNRTSILDIGWSEGYVGESGDPHISVPFPFRVAVSTGPGSVNNNKGVDRYVVTTRVCCESWHDELNGLSVFDENGNLEKWIKHLSPEETIMMPSAVAVDPEGNILVVDDYFSQLHNERNYKTYFLDAELNYIGVMEELGAPLQIVFHKGKVYTLTHEDSPTYSAMYINVFSYTN